MYGDVAAIAAGALANCRARNLNIIRVRPCLTEENDFVATTHRSSNTNLRWSIMQWRRRFQTQFKTGFQTEVNLSIGLKPDFRVQIKVQFKTIV